METIEELTDEDNQSKGLSKTAKRGHGRQGDATNLSDSGEGTEDTFPLETRPMHTRTAMGDYIVPKGGKPLTQHAFPSPGPGDYLPNHELTQQAAPQYSIVGRSKYDGKQKAPGPGDYNTSGDLIWNVKSVTLKAKGKTMITEEVIDPENTIGPAHNVRYLNTGKHAPKPSISSRHRPEANVGHPSNALSGIATSGLPTPGPNAYSPKITDKGKCKSFGILHRHGRSVQASSLGPGPAAYSIREKSTKSGYSLAKRLRADWQVSNGSPAPNSYNVASKIGKGLAMSIRSRQPYEHKSFGPSPNSYFLRDSMKYSDAPSATMTYRPFESDEVSSPGPTHYSTTDKTIRKAPVYSFRGICKYPIPRPQPAEDTPGPGTYLRPRTFTDNDAPAHSMGRRTNLVRSSGIEGPGPNHYNIRVLHRPDGKRAPSFTMAGRCDSKDKRIDDPAPTAYTPKLDTDSGPKYSMTARRKMKPRSDGAAPNSFTIKTNQTVKGRFSGPKATLKGRNTPFVYQGYAFQNSVRLRDA
ncbi:uncharacterized protein LOC121432054 [Lytechinus variegatus]|uniref:uncharacterized protein LOC121432054 n=1 Tax=Lytechinus variegatus TaxID=7654 RepID=UPI001BB21CF2|nr:uncharacterized protein LOC121432054 [Lytechinus variegatus]